MAYGISLFFGMPMEKALNAMNRRVETLDSISHVYFMAEQLTTEFNGVARDRKEVLRERTYLK